MIRLVNVTCSQTGNRAGAFVPNWREQEAAASAVTCSAQPVAGFTWWRSKPGECWVSPAWIDKLQSEYNPG